MEHFDVIVVGAGSAGSVLASRLTEGGTRRVAVIEWGSVHRTVEAIPAEVRQARAMGRIGGGSSALNGAYFCRGIPENFDHWAALGNDLWSYQEVLPYFRRLEADLDYPDDPAHGASGPVPVTRGLGTSCIRSARRLRRPARKPDIPTKRTRTRPGGRATGPCR